MSEDKKPQGVLDLKTQRGDETWTLPADWVGEDLMFSYRDTLMMTDQGPTFVNAPGTLIADLGSSFHVRTQGGDLVLPKCIVQQVAKPSAILGVKGMPGALSN